MEFVVVAHAVTIASFAPLVPKSIEICPFAISDIQKSSHVLYFKVLLVLSKVSTPPIPEPIHTPRFFQFTS